MVRKHGKNSQKRMTETKYQKSKLKKCIVCGKSFYYKHISHKCCSRECGMKYRDRFIKHIQTKCDVCGKEIKFTEYKFMQAKKHHCSKECYWKSQEKSLLGENNPMYGKKHTWEARYMMSKNHNLMAEGMNSVKGGKRKDLNDKYFRSSWEANYARLQNYLTKKWEYEPKTFYFPNQKRGPVSYTPDFMVFATDDDTYKWIEIKGWMDRNSKSKLRKFKKYYPTEFKKLEIIGNKEYTNLDKIYKDKISHWENRIDKKLTRKASIKCYCKKQIRENVDLVTDYLEQKDEPYLMVEPTGLFDGMFIKPGLITFFKFKFTDKPIYKKQLEFADKYLDSSTNIFIIVMLRKGHKPEEIRIY